MNLFSKILIFIFLQIFSLPMFVIAQKNVDYDINTKIKVKQSETIDKYLNDKSFAYVNDNLKFQMSFLDKVIYKIQRFLYKLFSYKHSDTVFYIFISVIFLFVIIKIFGLNYQAILYRKPGKAKSKLDVFSEDINSIDFDELISRYIQYKNYNLAVRYLFLKYLKYLSDTEIIAWETNKTNFDYRNEIKNTKYFQNYQKLSFFYEYIWYGEFPVDKEQFEYTKQEFDKSFRY